MNYGNQPTIPTAPRSARFVFTSHVSLLPPNDHILDGVVVGVRETANGFVYDVKHSSGVLRDVREDLLLERPAQTEKLYRGSFTDQGVPIVTVTDGDKVRTLIDEDGNIDGFNWGCTGGGPGRLARALAKDLLGVDGVAKTHQLKLDLVSQWPKDQPWTLFERHLRADLDPR